MYGIDQTARVTETARMCSESEPTDELACYTCCQDLYGTQGALLAPVSPWAAQSLSTCYTMCSVRATGCPQKCHAPPPAAAAKPVHPLPLMPLNAKGIAAFAALNG